MLTRLAYSTYRDEAYRSIRAAIMRSEFAPGEALSVEELSERLGVSPTPVREALMRLSAEGLVERTPNKTALVATPAAEDVRQAYELRRLLEPLAGRLAARAARSDPALAAEFTHMRDEAVAVRSMLAVGSVVSAEECERCQDIGLRLHDLMKEALGDTLLAKTLALVGHYGLRRSSLVTGSPNTHRISDLRAVNDEHVEIISAIEVGDEARTESAVAAHLSKAAMRALEHVSG